MGETIIIAVVNMLTPLTLLGLGLVIWKTRPPYRDLFGYKSKQSLKSPEAWEIAQAVFGRYCTLTYAVLSPLTLIASLLPLFVKFDELGVSILLMAVNFVNVIAFAPVIGVTESTVKKHTEGSDEPR